MAGDDEESAWILEDDECGQFDVVPTSGIEQALAKHFFFVHDRTGMITEGRDFRVIQPPPRCDVCGTGVELPWWEHICTPPLEIAADVDGKWLVCDACHELVLEKDVDALVERTWEIAKVTSPGVTNADYAGDVKAAVRRQTVLVLERFDAGRRETL